ncbi:MAG: CpsD/CapB family tyrosine-protein kinase [Oscillospiraceae bacterium]|nr:CpsD/CapB family tyrosine-protein kinase [Oscillospiraceae bacterium]
MSVFNSKSERGGERPKGHVLNEVSPFAIKENYNILRANIVSALPTDKCNLIGVTSPSQSEGKSTNCLNLAISFATAGNKVLLMDFDLRLPSIFRLLNLPIGPGVSDILIGASHRNEELFKRTNIENLRIITSGEVPQNPSVLLESPKMGDLFDMLASRYDYILIDMPPVNVVADAGILSKYMAGVVLVVRQNRTKNQDVKQAISQLNFAGVNILGVLLNDVKERQEKYGYGGYEYAAKEE